MANFKKFIRKCISRAKPKRTNRLRLNILGWLLKAFLSVFLIIITTGSLCLMAMAVYINKYIDTDMDMSLASTELNYTTQIYYTDENGNNQILHTLYGEQNREWVDFEDIPKYLRDAVIAIEDERFMTHNGVDWKRTISAGLNLVVGFSSNYGGSTITQQLIKNITQDNEVTVQRKIQEILRAMELEENMGKEEILEMYLNTINLSQGCYGVQTAAKVYFGKDVSELTLAECASIAGITNLPSYYDPFVYPEHNIDRQKDILWKMHELGIIDDEEYEEAKNEELSFVRDNSEEEVQTEEVQSYFVDLLMDSVISDLMSQLGYSKSVATKMLYSGGLQIYTTMNPKVQDAIESVYTDSSNFQRLPGVTQPQSAMIIYSTDGDILGVVGGRGTKQGARVLNRAKSLRSAGSSIKPLTSYSPALEYGLITPFSVMDEYPSLYTDENGVIIDDLSEAKGKIKVYPKNYYSGYRGKMTIRRAVELSVNTIPVQLITKLGIERSFSFLESKYGFTSVINTSDKGDLNYGSLALGGFYRGVSLLEMTSAYTTFINGGVHNEPRCYTLILDHDGNTLLDNSQKSTTVLSEQSTYYMTYMLESAVKQGTSTKAKIENIATAGKTGTTNDDKDRWFIGYTPYYVGGVWYGYDIPKEIDGADGNPALNAWKLVMDILHEGLEEASFYVPEGLSSASYCLDSGGIPTEACKLDIRGSRVSSGKVFSGDKPTNICDCHVTSFICKETGKLATPYCTDIEEVSFINVERNSKSTGIKAGDNKYLAVKIEIPSQYNGKMAWLHSSIEKSGGSNKVIYWVYGSSEVKEFCDTHADKPVIPDPDPSLPTDPFHSVINGYNGIW